MNAASLRDDDSVELGELLGFLGDWFAAHHDPLAASMHRFTFGLFTLDEIRRDVSRFAWALGVEVPIPDDADHDESEAHW